MSVETEGEANYVEEKEDPKLRKISLSSCGVCGSPKAKYRCPGCLKYSCSLLCVKKHKSDSGCSGVRDKTAFVALSHFDEIALLSDYRFLEDTGRFSDGASRDTLVQAPRTTSKAKKLATQARKMNITLRLLAVTFTKSRENSTFFLTREKMFLWHLKLVFPQSGAEFSQRRVSDRQSLKDILTPYIHPTESDPVTRQKLKVYAKSPPADVKVFMKAEGRKANMVRFHELDIEKSLRDNLAFKLLIEYPVLHVVLKDHWKEYPLKELVGATPACANSKRSHADMDAERQEATGASSPSHVIAAAEAPLTKRAKRGADEEEDLEEGEISDGSDDNDEKGLGCE